MENEKTKKTKGMPKLRDADDMENGERVEYTSEGVNGEIVRIGDNATASYVVTAYDETGKEVDHHTGSGCVSALVIARAPDGEVTIEGLISEETLFHSGVALMHYLGEAGLLASCLLALSKIEGNRFQVLQAPVMEPEKNSDRKFDFRSVN